MTPRRLLLAQLVAVGAVALSACAGGPASAPAPAADPMPPIVFVHGNGETAALWHSTIWRFESNGWPRDRLHALDVPFPQARDDDTRPQPGRTSTAEHMALLKAEVERVLRATGARQVVLVGNSRGGYAIRNYIQNGGGAPFVSHAVLGGTPNHGVWAVPGRNEGSEFAGTGPFLTGLNAPKNAAGDEVAGPVKWMTIRSDNNDKFAQPHGTWIGAKDLATLVSFAGPELKGAVNVVIPRIDHKETSYSPAAFEATYRFITGRAPATSDIVPEPRVQFGGKVTGLGLDPLDARSGNFANNLPLPGAQLSVHATDPATGERRGDAAYRVTVGPDGVWGPFDATPGTAYEFVVSAPGYATTHIYRGPFPRSSRILHLRAERIAAADQGAGAIVTMVRPRGYLDPARDRMQLDGQAPPGVPPGAGVSSAKIKPAATPRPVAAEFNGERIVGRVWPAAEGHVTILEMHH